MNRLEHLTTEYVEREDRIRLSGQLTHGDTVVLWLTQRLLSRLVPHLSAWLARQLAPASSNPSVQAAHQDIVQGFAQQAARAQLVPEPPVRASSPMAVWRVDAVDIAQGEDSLALTFKGEAGEPVLLTLSAQPLRQWLGIVYEQYRKAEWPTGVWPAWVEDAQVSAEASLRSVVLH